MVVSRTIPYLMLRARRQPQCECQQKGSTPMILLANVAAGWSGSSNRREQEFDGTIFLLSRVFPHNVPQTHTFK